MGNTILIAEDDEGVLKMLARYFRAFGFTVYPTATCAEAVKLADQYKPDCFLLDYHLDGARTAAEICLFVRGNEYLRKAPIVILSGDPEQHINTYGICQADAFVQKGGRCSEVVDLVKRHLARGDWHRGVLTRSDLTLDAMKLCVFARGRTAALLSLEQFRLFAVLFEKSPGFVTEEALRAYVFPNDPAAPRNAIPPLVYRLRQKLGPQLARRIKSKRYRGWIYVQPRLQTRKPSPGLQAV